jgi:hypothetical protein
MGGWRKYLELQLQARSGLSSALVVGALLALYRPSSLSYFYWLRPSFGSREDTIR